MKKLEYTSPTLEVINIELEGIVAASDWWKEPTVDVTDSSSNAGTSSTSSFLNNYSRK